MQTKKPVSSLRRTLKTQKHSIQKYGIIFIVMMTVLICSGLFFRYLARGLPSPDKLETYEPDVITIIKSANNTVIKELFKEEEKRELVPLDRIPEDMKNAVIATEDHRFYRHWGVDSKRFFKAAIVNIMALRYKEGFSTITMQLARGLYLGPEKKLTRKMREILTAIQIEQRYSKGEILEMYLNNSYFGHGAQGVQVAAQNYFLKDVDDLSLDECALLVAQLKAPDTYSPVKNPSNARKRRNLVLKNMLEHGYINPVQYDDAINQDTIDKVKYELVTEIPSTSGIAPYFTEVIRKELIKMQEEYNFDLFRDGLTVYTTLDTLAQAIAEQVVAEQLQIQQKNSDRRYRTLEQKIDLLEALSVSKNIDRSKIEELANDNAFMDSLLSIENVVQVAFVVIDLSNGHVLAMIGGTDYGVYKYNRAVQAKRQPGSAFKPFIYTVALDNGYNVTHELLDMPIPPILMANGDFWTPSNYEGTFRGWTTLREGFRHSLNLISVRLIQQIVPPKDVVTVSNYMGISTRIAAVPAIALGSSGVIPMEIISAFSAFPNLGIKVDPVYIKEIKDHFGNTIFENLHPVKREVLSKETAYIMTDLLKDVVQNGTGRNSHIVYGFNRPAGGKTGTTNDHTDAWFIGFTPQIVAGVWVGLDNPALSLGPGQSGAIVALPIWAKFMKTYHDTLDLPIEDFEMPDGVEWLYICSDTKELASPYCPVKVKEIFNSKFKPTKVCHIHSRIHRNH